MGIFGPILVGVLILVLIAWIALTIWAVNLVSNLFLTLREPSSLVSHKRVEGEEVDFDAEDGVRLKGKYIRAQGKPKATVIFCPEADSTLDSCSKYLGPLPAAGYNVFTFDFRGHGGSENVEGYHPRQWVSSHELYDLLGAMDKVKTLPGVDIGRIFLFGVSRGAATAICTAGITNGIRGVVADSAFSTKGLLNDYMRKWTSVIFPFKKGPRWAYWMLEDLGVFVSEIKVRCRFPSVENALRTMKTPVLMIHGAKDTYVSSAHAKKLFGVTRAPKEYLEVPNARHNQSVVVDPDLYTNKVLEFLKNN